MSGGREESYTNALNFGLFVCLYLYNNAIVKTVENKCMRFDDKIGEAMGSGWHIGGPQPVLFLLLLLIDPK